MQRSTQVEVLIPQDQIEFNQSGALYECREDETLSMFA